MKCYSIAQRQTKSNEKSPNWKGGRSRWRLREARRILLENNHNLTICELCGSKKIINIHHRNWQPNDNRINNLQVLCMSCHIKAHSKLINQILQLPTVQEFLKTLS
jgi:5-methylcytosine-specific restriction endonuclease McrA